MGRPQSWNIAIAAALFLSLAVASFAPIRSYDYFWHLATGRWIADHRELPRADPFTVGSDTEVWHNGEWLFQVALYPIFRAGGHEAVAVARGLIVAAIFTLGFLFARSHAATSLAFLLTVICWYGAKERLDARPSTVAALFVVLALIILFSRSGSPKTRAILYALLTAVWMNAHPSALLAPALAGIYYAGRMLGETADRRALLKEGGWMGSAAVAGLLANPYGVEGILAPVRLVGRIGEGHFVNAEWLPSLPTIFPLLYVTLVVGALLFITRPKDRGMMAQAFLFILFAWMSVRYVRNQGLYFAALPILLAPLLPMTIRPRIRTAALAAGVILLLSVATGASLTPAVDPNTYPVRAAAELERVGLKGNIYNPDQFGGFLSWTFYPERRVLIDGRNELHDTVIREYAVARLDSRAWDAMIQKYELTLAVDEYHRETMTMVDAVTGEQREMPSSLIYFPPARWALIAFDDVGMVFARRDAYPPDLLEAIELRHLVPDDPQAVRRLTPEELLVARRDLASSVRRFGAGRVTGALVEELSRTR
ncbi:MAG TPA: hypothetical protein VMS12_06805 [Thermoanaerobaculia bacterium]|nr:hypothetical protein [Thermoanaerobaculia bacterium]